ncbi:uncharacterized protein LOC131162622 [Malania oleifera]|uniref:uncharacterized protein LOC131162622 n=1 Tax=Malania oleifera TaxID=397392 RepID=UPI0025AD9E81|nr:uncharacterized protein LOC131162622 [Malania oleifera]
MKGVMRFGRKGKPSPGYVGLFKILEKGGLVAYKIASPLALSRIHDVFHMSVLRRYVPNPSHVIIYESLELRDMLAYEELLVQILDHREQKLRTKRIPLVKVWWRNLAIEAQWELEPEIRHKYPHLFRDAQC